MTTKNNNNNNNNNTDAAILAITVTAAAAAGAGLMRVYQKWQDYQTYRVPSELLLQSPYARELRLAARVAWKGM